MQNSPAARALLAIVVVSLGACGRAPPATVPAPAAQPQDQAQAAWSAFASQFIEDSFKADPFFAAQSGRHEFDGRMPDFSSEGLAREVARLHAARGQAEGFNTATLTPSERFERSYVLSVIDKQLFWRERARAPFTNPKWYVDQLDPELYLSRNYAPLDTRLKGYLGYARAIPQVAANIRANLQTPLAKPLLERGVAAFGGFATFYRKDVAAVFAQIQDPGARKELAEANDAAAKAMEDRE
jgi:hypothetical protein